MWRQDTTKAAEPRAKLSRRGLRWALEAIVCQHLTVARVAEGLGVAWNTANDAVLAEGKRVLIDDTGRFDDGTADLTRPVLVVSATDVEAPLAASLAHPPPGKPVLEPTTRSTSRPMPMEGMGREDLDDPEFRDARTEVLKEVAEVKCEDREPLQVPESEGEPGRWCRT